MSIARSISISSLALMLLFLGAIIFSAIEFQSLRFGGALHQRNQLLSDLNADILPPPEFQVEAMLLATAASNDPDYVEVYREDLAKLEREYRDRKEYWKSAGARLSPQVNNALSTEVSKSADHFWKIVDDELLPALSAGNQSAAKSAHAKLQLAYGAHRRQIKKLVEMVGKDQLALSASTKVTIGRITLIVGVLVAAVIAALIGMVIFLRRRVVRPLGDLNGVMLEMGAGQINLAIPGTERADELGDIARALGAIKAHVQRSAEIQAAQQMAVQQKLVGALSEALSALERGRLDYRIIECFPEEYEALRTNFNDAVDALAGLIEAVAESSRSVRDGAGEVASASGDLFQRTENQAASLEETAASVRTIASSIRVAAATSQEASNSARDANGEAVSSGAVMREAVAAMEAIAASSEQMRSIIAAIDGIAFQTNLLALNAGVEAARAGDAGNGFAVVANEVRALALRSAEAAKDIGGLIQASANDVENGVRLVNQTEQSLARIVAKTSEVSELIASLATSGQDQANSVQEVNSVIGSLDQITQQNAALVQQASSASLSLSQSADRLSEMVSRFDLGKELSRGHQAGAPSPDATTFIMARELATAPRFSAHGAG